jgi:hypothetical protein
MAITNLPYTTPLISAASTPYYTPGQQYTIGTIGSAMGIGTGTTTSISNSSWPSAQRHNIFTDLLGKEIVRILEDGTVKWADGIKIDEAAKALSESLVLGYELSAKITYSIKQRMRDSVFEEMISMAEEKGSITAEDLTFLWRAAKIIDKLKGKE